MDGRPGRADDLAKVLVGSDGRPQVSVLRAEKGAALPLQVERMERHPLGTQAFIPVNGGRFFVVVAPAGEFDPSAIRAFVTNGRSVGRLAALGSTTGHVVRLA